MVGRKKGGTFSTDIRNLSGVKVPRMTAEESVTKKEVVIPFDKDCRDSATELERTIKETPELVRSKVLLILQINGGKFIIQGHKNHIAALDEMGNIKEKGDDFTAKIVSQAQVQQGFLSRAGI